MNSITKPVLFFLLLLSVPALTFSEDISDEEAMVLGRQILEMKKALETPSDPKSVETIKVFGQDSRYYVLVRGWVVQHLQMAESYRGTSEYKNSPERQLEVEKRISALQKILRLIDLE